MPGDKAENQGLKTVKDIRDLKLNSSDRGKLSCVGMGEYREWIDTQRGRGSDRRP